VHELAVSGPLRPARRERPAADSQRTHPLSRPTERAVAIHAANRSASRRRSHSPIRFQLTKVRLTIQNKRLTLARFVVGTASLGCVEKIGNTIAKEENWVRVGMGGALMSIGQRNKKLNAAAIKVAKAIGPIHFSDGDKKCEPMNVLKHLTSDYLRNKLGI
jgi:hypothetical protein